ncbi:MAG: hypothetical protein G8345_02540 [Magnetococcales bacterium]|nr:hypothetical protein [Magnetococcales bacterium]
MAGATNTIFAKMTSRVYPRVPDFYSMIMKQSQLAVATATNLDEFIKNGTKSRVSKIREIHQESEALLDVHLTALKNSVATPIDREDIFRAFVSVDNIIPAAEHIVNDMGDLGVQPNEAIQQMVTHLRAAVEALNSGYSKLATSPAAADQDAEAVFAACASLQRVARDATANLLKCDAEMKALKENQPDAKVNAVNQILNIFKQREIYRQLHDAGLTMNDCGKVLHDIVVQVA